MPVRNYLETRRVPEGGMIVPLTNMKDMLRKARNERYAVGAFNILDYSSMKAVIAAAVESGAPVIVQTSVKTVDFWGLATMVNWARELAKPAPVPVALHLDHCRDTGYVSSCIDAGWTSVMIDASDRPFEENLALTRDVVGMALPHDVSVEAELGAIGGVEDAIDVKDEDARYADPDQANRFCAELQLDCFAPAIGTAHGAYRKEPRLDFDRLKTIAGTIGVPIALHGGTGLSDDVFLRCISLGCAKINISTQLKHIFIDSFAHYHTRHPGEYNPLKVLGAQFAGLKETIADKIELFGSEGKA